MVEWTAWTILALTGGGLLGLGVRYLLFRLGCIMADLNNPALGRSLLVVLLVAALTIPLGWWVGTWLIKAEETLSVQSHLILYPGLTLYGLVAWVVAATLYSLLLAASYKKSLVIAGVELLLSVLLIVLLTSLVMVGLAGWQISHRPPAQSELAPRQAPSGIAPGAKPRLWQAESAC